jgi:proteasome lid subunit RPN8/RPN11
VVVFFDGVVDFLRVLDRPFEKSTTDPEHDHFYRFRRTIKVLIIVHPTGCSTSIVVLQLHPDHLQELSAHAERTYPNECCGLLIGELEPGDPSEQKTLVEVWATPNAWTLEAEAMMGVPAPYTDTTTNPPQALTQSRRYWIDPSDMLEGQRHARELCSRSGQRPLDIIGIYHSHPDHAAVPSECDRTCAWSQYSYIILSVQQGAVQDIRCWKLDDTHQFQPEELIVLEPA